MPGQVQGAPRAGSHQCPPHCDSLSQLCGNRRRVLTDITNIDEDMEGHEKLRVSLHLKAKPDRIFHNFVNILSSIKRKEIPRSHQLPQYNRK